MYNFLEAPVAALVPQQRARAQPGASLCLVFIKPCSYRVQPAQLSACHTATQHNMLSCRQEAQHDHEAWQHKQGAVFR